MDITYKPKSLKEALELLNEKDLFIFAGGTDIAVKTRQGKGKPFKSERPFLFISGIPEITRVFEKDDWLYIGAATTYNNLLKYNNLPDILKQAIKVIAAPGIRNLGTIGGNICNSSPAGDTLPPLYCMDAIVVIQSIDSQKEIPISRFITAPGKNLLGKNRLLTYVKIKKQNFPFQKFIKVGSRKAQTLSKVSVAFMGNREKKKVKIAFGAVGPTVKRDVLKEEELGKIIFSTKNNIDFTEFSSIFNTIIAPIDDQRSTALYRKEIALRAGFALLKEFLSN